MMLTPSEHRYSRRLRQPGTSRWARCLLLATALAVSVTLAACGGSAASGGSGASVSKKGPLTVGVFDAFEGSEAFQGPEREAECYAAATQINAAGGVLGRKFQCVPADSTSDPADAVPNATKMLATAHNLVLIDGPGDEELATDSVVAPSHVVEFGWSATPAYDHQTNPFWYRFFPSDALAGAAEADYLIKAGYTHAAGVFDTSAGAQVQVPDLLKTYAKLGGKMAINLKLAPGNTYRTEVSQLLQAKPDAIITELDTPQETSAFFSELSQLSGGKVPPIIATEGAVASSTNWPALVTKAIGAAAAQHITQVATGGSLNSAGYAAFKHALLTSPEKIVNRGQYLGLQYVAQGSDAVVIDALAIDEAKSTNSSKVAPLIYQIANGVPGAVTVSTYAQGVKAIAAGHRIRYVGGGGPILLNTHHNIVSPFTILRWEGPKAGWVLVPGDTITPTQLTKLTP